MSRVTVVGAGAIGGFVAARLHAAGADVTVVDADRDHVASIRAHGLRVVGAATTTANLRALLPDEVARPLELVLLAVKARETARALRTVAPLLADDGVVVSLQNGLEEYRIAEVVGARRTIGAALTFGGHYEAPGIVHHGGSGTLHVGELDGSDTPRVRRVAELLSQAHPATVSDDIFAELWSKEALGAFYFATALVDADLLEILDRHDVLGTLGVLVGEVARVAEAEGVRLRAVDGFDPEAFLHGDRERIEASWESQRRYWRRLDARRTGVWRDLNVRRRPTEVREIVDPVTERARRHGVEVPRLLRLRELIEQAESGRIPAGYEAVAELA